MLFGLHVKMICHMQYCIAWQGIDKCLGSTLGIYHTSDVVQVAQDVKAIKHPRQLSLEHGTGKAGIPEQIVGIHRTSFVTTAGIHGQVGTHLNMPRQIERGCSSIVEIHCIDVVEVHCLAVNISPGCGYLYAHGRRATYLIVKLQGFIEQRCLYSAAGCLITSAFRVTYQIYAIHVFHTCPGSKGQSLHLVKRLLETIGS